MSCAGQSRYPNLRPKWMLTHPDGELIEKVINSIDINDFRDYYYHRKRSM